MTLVELQNTMYDALRALDFLRGNAIPVIMEDEGNVAAEWDARFARSHMAVTVGAASFEATTRDGDIIVGRARVAATVWEQPSRNRVGQGRMGPNATEVAEAIGCAVHGTSFMGARIKLVGIGAPVSVDDKTVARQVSFETLATLTGEFEECN